MGVRTITSPVGAEIVIDGQTYVNFGGSSYLGLSGNPAILDAGVGALRTGGAGYQFARNYQLATPAHQAAEAEAASFFGTSSAVYLASGYSVGLVAMPALSERFTKVFYDELAHHCLREAIAASGLPAHSFRHLSADGLALKLSQHVRAGDRPLIASDGMYSTFGEIAPLDEFVRVMAPFEGRLLVDESHAFGVLGDTGQGAVEHHGVRDWCALIGGSTSKGLGVVGGIIPADEEIVAKCRATPASRSASAGLPAAAAMCAASLRYVREHPEIRTRLRANTAYMKSGLRKLGIDIADTIAPVASFVAGADRPMHTLQEALMARGIYVLHSNYIGVNSAGAIRCGIFADHSTEQMDRLFDALRTLL